MGASSRGKMTWRILQSFLLCVSVAYAQTLGLGNGFITKNTTIFNIALVKDSQTLFSLTPNKNPAFDFIPSDEMTFRQGNGNYHLGDITFRARTVGSNNWISGDTSTDRRPVTAFPPSGSVFAASNLTPTLSVDSPLNIVRHGIGSVVALGHAHYTRHGGPSRVDGNEDKGDHIILFESICSAVSLRARHL
ncbi:hypothetical protein CVT24_001802 [Panaeolus cyanescens]|uniref:Uncharacterized protein n=1 Tax=Panaeolus cyanescens TaxID=181874 RepID=A0A409YFI9_9AGAR|nr:hypothetical protein CVT24_001802 [Panaeolus cyanescens]